MLRRVAPALIALLLLGALAWWLWPASEVPAALVVRASASAPVFEEAGGSPDEDAPRRVGATLSGRVLLRGEPVEGARVVLRTDGVVLELASSSDGAFRFDGLSAGQWLVSASSGGHASEVVGPIALAHQEQRTELVLELLPSASVSGVVMDARTREVIPGARIRSSSGTVVADHAGRFKLSPVPLGHTWLEASAQGYAPRTEWLTVQSARDHGGMEVFLRPASTVSGLVTRLGQPVAGASVWAERADLSAAQERFGPVSSDGEGRFSLELGTGEMRLAATAPGGPRVDGPRITVAEGRGRDDLQIELGEGLTAYGTVTVDGEPAESARLTILDGRTEQITAQLGTGPGGAFRVEGIAPGPYLLQVSAGAVTAQRGPFQLSGASDAPWNVDLESARTLRGRVEPVRAGVTVRWRTLDWVGPSSAETVTASDGTFSFPGAPEGLLRVEAEMAGAFARTEARAGDDVVLRLSSSVLQGFVVDDANRAVTDFQIRVLPLKGGRTEIVPILHPQGEFQIDVAPGEYEVSASAAGYGETVEPARVEVLDGRTSSSLKLALARPLEVRGRVVDQETGAPLEGVEVTVFRGGSRRAVVNLERSAALVTGSDGTFRFGAIPREAGLRLRKSGFATRWAPARMREGELGDLQMRALQPGDRSNDGPGIAEPYEGVGMSLHVQGPEVFIRGVFEGGPAQTAGILAGDEILAIDGQPVAGWPANQVTQRIMGPSGTLVRLSLRRGDRTFELALRRRSIQL